LNIIDQRHRWSEVRKGKGTLGVRLAACEVTEGGAFNFAVRYLAEVANLAYGPMPTGSILLFHFATKYE